MRPSSIRIRRRALLSRFRSAGTSVWPAGAVAWQSFTFSTPPPLLDPFAWGGSIASGIMGRLGWTAAEFDVDFLDGMAEVSKLGYQAFVPDLIGSWGWTLFITFGLLLIWYLFVRYNESTNKFTVF